jgi:DNA polymerase delta subunit 1
MFKLILKTEIIINLKIIKFIIINMSDYIYRAYNNISIDAHNDDIEFQVIDWYSNDMPEILEDSSDESENEFKKKRYPNWYFTIRAYGVTENGNSVCVHISDFKPYFYVNVPDIWNLDELKVFTNELKKLIDFRYKNEVDYKRIRYIDRKNLYGFTNNRLFKFIKIVTKSKRAFYDCQSLFSMPNTDNRNYEKNIKRKNEFEKKLKRYTNDSEFTFNGRLFESNIDPLLRFMHIRDILPSGWIRLKKNRYTSNFPKQSHCQLDLNTTYKSVYFQDKNEIAPLLVASFDIECSSGDGSFPQSNKESDKVIQIGTTVRRVGDTECCLKHIVTLNTCDPIDDTVIEEYDTERNLLKGWVRFITRLDPDIITGYNIWGFDFKFMFEKAKILHCYHDFNKMGRYINSDYDEMTEYNQNKYRVKQLSSSALGQNFLYYVEMEGRSQIDLMKLIQKDYNLESYKLDNVCSHFMKMNKVDLPIKELFEYYRIGTPDLMREIAIYCIQDNELCNNLLDKLSVVPNNVGMSNVCSIPFAWLFMRGQGIKIQSLVAKQCRKESFLIPVVKKGVNVFGNTDDEEDGYEGAIVLQPQVGLYLDIPIAVMDYASLYPSSMIAENISHDTLVVDERYDNLEDYNYNEIEYDVYEGKGDDKRVVGKKVCRFAEKKDGEKAILPRILAHLLKARKDTRKLIPLETNPFKKGILEGLQLSYKLTANSLYGQVGSSVSPIYLKELGASTTAVGRRQIYFARDQTLQNYPGSECIYGDTDSVFIKFNLKQKGEDNIDHLSDTEKLQRTIDLGISAGKMISLQLKPPNDLEYEKSFFPFCLFSKKRYIGNLYETDPTKFKQKSMGIALKRRDYCPIVKIIYGGIMDIILNERDINKAKRFFVDSLNDMFAGKYALSNFVISKTLKSDYKNPLQNAHYVLAKRIGERTGEFPASNDRIPYIFIELSELKCQVCNKKVNEKNCKCIGCNRLYCNNHLRMECHIPCAIKCRICNKNLQKNEYCQPDSCHKCKKIYDNINKYKNCKYCNGWFCANKCNIGHNCITQHKCYTCTGWYCMKHLNSTSNGHKCSKITNKILQGDRIEDPKYIEDNNIKVDYREYLERQIETATLQIFALTMVNPKSLIEDIIRTDNHRKNGVRDIKSFFTVLPRPTTVPTTIIKQIRVKKI